MQKNIFHCLMIKQELFGISLNPKQEKREGQKKYHH
jgi:hypothetical protein